jgi:hypothetical protein
MTTWSPPPDIADQDLHIGDRRGEDLVDRAHEFREVDAEGGIGHALREQHQHDQSRHDEGAVGHAVDLLDALADRGTEDDEVERGGEDGRDHALEHGAAPARHFEE